MVFNTFFGSLHKQGDERDEELWADDVHLRIAMRDIDNARVVQLAVRFEQRYEHGKLTVLGPTVVVELLEEIFILVLGGRRVHLVFHLEHNGNVFEAIGIVTEDEITLAPTRGIIVFLKICIRKERAHAVELRAAMYFERLANHLGRHLGLQVFVVVHFLLFLLQLKFILLAQTVLTQSGLTLFQLHPSGQSCNLVVLRLQGLLRLPLLFEHSHLAYTVPLCDSSLQAGYLLLFLSQFGLQFQFLGLREHGKLCLQTFDLTVTTTDFQFLRREFLLQFLLELHGVCPLFGLMLLLKLCHTPVDFRTKLRILHLGDNRSIISLVHLKHTMAFRTFYLFHTSQRI